MELKTNITAEEGKQEILITRSFDLPLPILFKAYEDPNLLAQWMGTTVIELNYKKHGSWRFETTTNGQVVFAANGVILEFEKNNKITRTFEMENTDFPIQLEFYEFKAIDDQRSMLTMQIIFKSNHFRNQLLKMPFQKGLDMAHNKLQQILEPLKLKS